MLFFDTVISYQHGVHVLSAFGSNALRFFKTNQHAVLQGRGIVQRSPRLASRRRGSAWSGEEGCLAMPHRPSDCGSQMNELEFSNNYTRRLIEMRNDGRRQEQQL